MANTAFFLVPMLPMFAVFLTNLCSSDIELRKCCGRCFGAVPALRRRESVGFAFLRSDERLYEVGGCLYLEVGEALGVAHVVVVALTRTDVAEAVGYAGEIRMLFLH